jgi:hypothetical protein
LVRAAVAVVEVVAQVVAVRPVVLREVVEGRGRLAHKRLPLVRLQVAVVAVPCPVALPPQAEVAALLLVQGLVASESLGSR